MWRKLEETRNVTLHNFCGLTQSAGRFEVEYMTTICFRFRFWEQYVKTFNLCMEAILKHLSMFSLSEVGQKKGALPFIYL